jgi:hypothetical protein
MLQPLPPTLNTASAPAPAPAAPVLRAGDAAAASVVVTVSAGARVAASQDSAKVATGVVHAQADVNSDGTVSDQEQQTENAQLALKRALMEGSPDLEQALQAYQAIASMADAQR